MNRHNLRQPLTFVTAAFDPDTLKYQIYARTSDRETHLLIFRIDTWSDIQVQCAVYQWLVRIAWKEDNLQIATTVFDRVWRDMKQLRRKYAPTALDHLITAVERLFQWRKDTSHD